MAHGWRYAFDGPGRLAKDVGISVRTLRRILCGETVPSIALARALCAALGQDLGLPPLPQGEVFVAGPATKPYPTPSTCRLCGNCAGCLPDAAWGRRGRLRREWREALPGDWCCYPPGADAAPKDARVLRPMQHPVAADQDDQDAAGAADQCRPGTITYS